MPLFTLIGRDGPHGLELRKTQRDLHLQKLRPLSAQGRVKFAGPLRNEAGEPKGSVIIFEAADLREAKAIAAADPYTTSGVFETVEVFETLQVFPE
ncbi:MAG TPA: YciI family protein [Polyangiaceae bacterium]|nr:YciI family protein [Polyangiaceae bacterium]